VSAIVPVYNSAGSLPELTRRVVAVLDRACPCYEVVLVNDGSSDASWETIIALSDRYPQVRGLDLSRNFGQHNAVLAGIRAARGDICVTLDDDLQNPPEEIPKLLEPLSAGADAVYGTSEERSFGAVRNLVTRLATRILLRAMGAWGPAHGSFRALLTELRSGFEGFQGRDVSIDALLAWSTTRFASVPVRHAPSKLGRSRYSTRALASFALTRLTVFSTRPLRIASVIGLASTLAGAAAVAYLLVRHGIGGTSVPGVPFLASLVTILAGAQLLATGIIGEYLARAHVRIMGQPSYAVRERTGRGLEAPAEGPRSESGKAMPTRGSVRLAEPQAVEPPGRAPCAHVPWDSAHFGLRIARLRDNTLTPALAADADRWCREHDVDCLYFLARCDDPATTRAAEDGGFRLVDMRLTLERRIVPAEAFGDSVPGITIRKGEPDDLEQLQALARISHSTTRFYYDGRFPSRLCDRLYERWIANCLESPEGNLEVAESGTRLVGYCSLRGREGGRGLAAVAEEARGRGIGRALVRRGITRLFDNGIDYARAVVQARNTAAQRLFASCGFLPHKLELWYHKWYGP